MKYLLRICVVFSIAFLLSANAQAQAAATAELDVTVKDPQGAVVKSAQVC